MKQVKFVASIMLSSCIFLFGCSNAENPNQTAQAESVEMAEAEEEANADSLDTEVADSETTGGNSSDFVSGYGTPAMELYAAKFDSLAPEGITLKNEGDHFSVLEGETTIGAVRFADPEGSYDMLLTVAKNSPNAKDRLTSLISVALLTYNDGTMDVEEALGDAQDIYEYGADGPCSIRHQFYEVGNVNNGQDLAVRITQMN